MKPTSGKRIRTDPTAAEGIIRSFFQAAETEQLRSYVRFLADDASFLGERSPDGWGVTLLQELVRLNVGWVECLVLGSSVVRVLVDVDLVPTEFKLDGVVRRRAPDCDYVSVPIKDLASVLPKLEEAHRTALGKAARTPTHHGIRNAHSTGVTAFLGRFLKRRVPDPGYLDARPANRAGNYWVVKGRPKENAWSKVLVPGSRSRWCTARAPKALRAGDRAFCWSSSPELRIVSLALVRKTKVGRKPNGDTIFELEYLTRKLAGTSSIQQLREIPGLQSASFLKPGPATTLLSLRPEEAKILFQFLCAEHDALRSIWPDLALPRSATFHDIDIGAVREGDLRFVQHLRRERDPRIVEAKRRSIIDATGKLNCEVCSFDFREVYGQRGDGFCEVHHIVPLSERPCGAQTRLEDLAIVCSNCHRMLHRDPIVDLGGLRRSLESKVIRVKAPTVFN